MTSTIDLLTPRPLDARPTDEWLDLAGAVDVRVETDDDRAQTARRRLARALEASGIGTSATTSEPGSITITLRADEVAERPREGYRLEIGTRGVEIIANSPSGLFYGVETFAQWLRLHESGPDARVSRLPGVKIEDRPAFARRGVMLDVSRNKVPTLKTIFRLVDRLASWKINELQLYTEHTFAYEGHEEVWSGWSPLTGDEIRALDRHCAERHVELVPNQQSLGHFHRWLVHDRYRPLAECPTGVAHPFSTEREPFSLCPTDAGSLELLEDLYGQLLPNFSSSLFNVGLDETFDLGSERSAEACADRGRQAVYLDFLSAVHKLAARHGRRVQFWADIILEHPQLIDRIPADAIVLNWGYEADHPFARETAVLARSGRDFYVCPGTSSWNSFAGRAHNALENLRSAARHGLENGAVGYLVTDWGDNGHLQPLVASSLGFLAGAAQAWNPEGEGSSPPWHRLLDLHAFGARTTGLGRVAMALGNAYLACGTPSQNGSVLFHLLVSPDDTLDHPRYAGLEKRGLEAVCSAVDHARRDLESATSVQDELDSEFETSRRELEWAANALDLGARVGLARLGAERSGSLADLRQQEQRNLAQGVGRLTDSLPPIWLARSRQGGLEASLRRLAGLRDLLA